MDLLKSHVCCLAIILLGLLSGIESQRLDGNALKLPNHGLCSSKDIRNHPKYLEKLRNCSVIVGTLQIVLIDGHYNMSEYVFPELREVTQFVILYRVESMSSLGHMFPNLALIRGQRLFHNYALVIFEMPQLQEIGLRALMTIQRGFVRIERNPQLCYTQTINWKNITGNEQGHHFSENGNPLCPQHDACRGCDERRCWSSKNCQRIPFKHCHKECLGGCTLGGLCNRCKTHTDEGVCVSSCPSNKFIQPGSLECITKEFCSELYGGHGWTFENICISHCPIGYETIIKDGIKTCLFCGDNCNITCSGAEIINLELAQALKGCHFVNGSLYVKMYGEFSHEDVVMQELEESLGGIREIRGHLKVYRSSTITSLKFLKNLTIVHGLDLLYGKYSFIVHEMSNLQEMWNWDTKKVLAIKRGTLFFHHNPKLCVKFIHRLANMTNVTINDHDVCLSSNGYKIACHQKTLYANSSNIGQTFATISWERMVREIPDDDHSVDDIGYLVHYYHNPEDEIETHIGIDSCTKNMWKSVFVREPRDPKVTEMSQHITDLIPYTRYAYYVQTYNRLRDRKGIQKSDDGQSKIQFFRTVMSRPPKPHFLETISYTNDSLTLYWRMPTSYTGIVSHYVVELEIELDGSAYFDKSDYCENSYQYTYTLREPKHDKPKIEENGEESATKVYADDCVCPDRDITKEIQRITEELNKKSQDEMGEQDPCKKVPPSDSVGKFLDFLTALRCGYFDNERRNQESYDDSSAVKVLHRAVREAPEDEPETFNIHEMLNLDTRTSPSKRRNKMHNDKYHFLVIRFSGKNNDYTITNLRHFGYYRVLIYACIGGDNEDCGPSESASERTLADFAGDRVIDFKVVSVNRSVTDFVWSEPKEPNAAILSYTLQYKRLDLEYFTPLEVCITRKQHEKNQFKFTVWNLDPGPYASRVKSASVANAGQYSPWVEFHVAERMSTVVVLSLLGACLVGICLVAAVIIWRRKRAAQHAEDMRTLLRSPPRMGVRYRRRSEDDVQIFDMN